MSPFRERGFGLDWQADIALSQFDPLPPAPEASDVVVSRAEQLAGRVACRHINRGEVFDDGVRFNWKDEVTFDVYDGNRVEYCPGAGWRDELPAAFFSTVTGLVLAWRGMLPLHATALDFSGRAILLAGRAGAGKSTLAAELMQEGAQLLSDDLTVLGKTNGNDLPIAFRGRQSMRLHPGTAITVDASRSESVPQDLRGKRLVWPHLRTSADSLPVAGMILLGNGQGPVSSPELMRIMPRVLFRPRWMATIPGHAARRADLLDFALRIPAWLLPRISGFSVDDRSRRVGAALEAVEMLASSTVPL